MPEKIPVHQYDPGKGEPSASDLYAKRRKIQPRSISGAFEHWRNFGVWLILGLYFSVAWINYHGRQALLFDLPNRHFYVFGWTFWPQDFILLSWLLIISAFTLFAVTVFAGRVWCGYACPQTVWTKLFLHIEKWTEGDRNARMRLDKAPLTLNKALRRTTKHLGWVVVSLLTGLTFIGYFDPIRSLWSEFKASQWNEAEVFWMFLFAATTYLNAGWLREPVCMYMCPYGRFQSVMFDRDTLMVSYDHARGEPRGSRRRDADPKAAQLGDCIDCELCVQVCPTGIDIRNGLQFECIACAACIDACDSVMEQMGYAKGLVRYTTENALEHGHPIHILRPRLIGYSLMILFMATLFIYTLSTRNPMGLDVIRDRNALYRESSEGLIENSYILNVMNKSQDPEDLEIHVQGMPPGSIMQGTQHLHLLSGELRTVTETLEEEPEKLHHTEMSIDFHVNETGKPGVAVDAASRFFAPAADR